MRALCTFLFVCTVGSAAAQPPDVPTDAGDAGRISVGGELTATYGSEDPGFFNYATYAYDPLRNVRVVFDASLRPVRQIELLAQVRTDGVSQARMAALYVRVRPWRARDIDLQAGRVPTAFGLFGRTAYGSDSALVGRPLPYGYLLSLRRDAVPAGAADLLRMRGRGWLSSFPRGNVTPDRGLPIVNTDTWDTGVQLRLANTRLAWVGAVTAGSLGSPRLDDDNGGRALSTRLTARLHPGLVVGVSGAQGAYLSRGLDDTLIAGESTARLQQRAAGADLEFSAGRWLARGELIASRWDLPAFTGTTMTPVVTSLAAWGEGRVRLMPGLDLGLRIERLDFGDVATQAGIQPWEAPVSRLETGVAFAPVRHARLKLALQHNRRPLGGRVRQDTLLAAQVSLWF
ncbi:MAG: hypothetical protein JNL48_14775 [Acidobacteria bacterium]|nr:hypothetical protein [Acidobacteriota bacterium]